MAEISATLIKELRERTGVGMGKCKEALVEARGDMELAISNLRKAGMTSAVKKQGRQTNEGVIASAQRPQHVSIVEVNSETDFVVQNSRFQQFVSHIAEEIAQTFPVSLEAFLQQKYSKDSTLTIDEYRATIVQTIGENIQIKRLKVIPRRPNHSLGVYSHLGGKIIVIVEVEGSSDEEALAKGIAMHIAAASPEYLSPENVPHAVLENEREIARSQVKGKPENVVEKIVEGKVKAFYDAVCLTHQHYIRDDRLTIAQVVAERAKEVAKPLKISQFIRWSVGE